MSIWSVVVAAGSGNRFGTDTPKQLLPLRDKPIVAWAVAAARRVSDGIVVVRPPGDTLPVEADRQIEGGSTRSASVRAGLAQVPDEAGIILVHDAARPLAGEDLFQAVINAVRDDGADAALPCLPVVDTLKRISGDGEAQSVNRDELVVVQTPQAFKASFLRSVHETNPEATDDAGLVEAAGGKVVVVEGDPRNLKVTVPSDLVVAEALLL